MNILNEVKFDDNGLVPAVLQNCETGEVLMTAYMNADTLAATIETGKATFWSRSRQKVWIKGETSGNYMFVKEIRIDCDGDCLLLSVSPAGNACHTGNRTCFYRKSVNGELIEDTEIKKGSDILTRLTEITLDRKKNPKEGSYTNYLFDKGEDKILKKVGEEAAEVVIASKNRNKDEIKYESADLLYHMTVMLVDNDLTWEDVFKELESRR